MNEISNQELVEVYNILKEFIETLEAKREEI